MFTFENFNVPERGADTRHSFCTLWSTLTHLKYAGLLSSVLWYRCCNLRMLFFTGSIFLLAAQVFFFWQVCFSRMVFFSLLVVA